MAIHPSVIDAVEDRSDGACEASTPDCVGSAAQFHHRKLRKHGGPDTVRNLLHVCAPCHHWIHHNPAVSYEHGLLLHQWEDPDA